MARCIINLLTKLPMLTNLIFEHVPWGAASFVYSMERRTNSGTDDEKNEIRIALVAVKEELGRLSDKDLKTLLEACIPLENAVDAYTQDESNANHSTFVNARKTFLGTLAEINERNEVSMILGLSGCLRNVNTNTVHNSLKFVKLLVYSLSVLMNKGPGSATP